MHPPVQPLAYINTLYQPLTSINHTLGRVLMCPLVQLLPLLCQQAQVAAQLVSREGACCRLNNGIGCRNGQCPQCALLWPHRQSLACNRREAGRV